ncbi:hypothetical protein BU26DRAFT_276332 [Trematosphaeria pertusa]|uniref:Basic proline-rich protein n=1 Tax=Trematosphaeria pertusa TaxID=390896 RepID=A0A6A6IKG4_9PLEO|nr:uncharacterized protein BU26DRAFT_276332 [Trematosphaeria pertusa]KAF2251104.1 hypothetical protein BU26DRAFT_276332 [Trematosphaeria pertusa]
MTAANLTSSPPSLPAETGPDGLISHLKAMTTSSAAAQETTPTSHNAAPETPSHQPRQDAELPRKLGATEQDPIDPFGQHSEAQPRSEGTSSSASTMGKTIGSLPDEARRPSTPRAQTDPSPSFDLLPTHHPRPRNRSPYSRSHLRSHSGSSSLSAPPMMRAHSLPAVISPSTHLALSPSPMPGRPSSPLRSPKRTRSPRSHPSLYSDDSYTHSGAPSVCDISEDAELELTPKAGVLQPSPISTLYSSTGSLSRRRRPASPLSQVSLGSTGTPSASTPRSGSSSPLLSSAKFNEPFPGVNAHYPSSLTSSSMPSTPTSMRSRSPSISSLETIPDTPDAEAEAAEADRIARLKAAADLEKEGTEGARRSSLDVPGGSGRTLGFGKRDSRKRWSVCGAERRGDLDLETIWED